MRDANLFEPLWTLHSYHELLSKTGWVGIKNSRLNRIDNVLKQMNSNANQIIRNSIDN